MDYRDDKWPTRVVELTDGAGVDVVFDPIGAVDDGLKCLKYGGKILVVGFAARGGVMEKVSMNKVLLKGAGVIGYVSAPAIYNLVVLIKCFVQSASGSNLEEVLLKLLSFGEIQWR